MTRDPSGVPTMSRAAFFVSDSTGITAETLGSALLANFPGVPFRRHTIPFVDTVEGARNVVRDIQRSTARGVRSDRLRDGEVGRRSCASSRRRARS